MPRRKLERIYTSALTLAAPELLSQMGMGMGMGMGEENATADAPEAVAGVDLETVAV